MDFVIVDLEFWFDRIPDRSYGLVGSGMNTSYRYLKYQRSHSDLLTVSISLCRASLRDCSKPLPLLPRSIPQSFDLPNISRLFLVSAWSIRNQSAAMQDLIPPMITYGRVQDSITILLAIVQSRTLILLDLHLIDTFSVPYLSMFGLKCSFQSKLISWRKLAKI
jgi:hypothetical protein